MRTEFASPFEPLLRPMGISARMSTSCGELGSCASQEDSLIIKLVEKFGTRKWSLIANHLNGRSGKQCRERYAHASRIPGLQDYCVERRGVLRD